ncbi:MAG: NAD-dependent epimerase/dehydratase family protein [Undibacterium sp.]
MLERYDSILIGGSGFVGTQLARHLVAAGERVLNLSRHQTKEPVSGVDFAQIDFKNQESLTDFILPQADSIIILIGQVGPAFDSESDRQALQAIVNLVNAQANPIKVLYCSTALVYGNCNKPALESDPLRPIEPYAIHKSENENFLKKHLAPQHSLGILRLSNVFGDIQGRGFVSLIMNRLLVPGTDVFRVNGDGDQERDYIYVDDLAGAITSVKGGLKGQDTVNIATGESWSLIAVLDTVQSVSGKELLFKVTHKPVVEAVKIQISNDHLRERYGYTPRHTFVDGLKLMWERACTVKTSRQTRN